MPEQPTAPPAAVALVTVTSTRQLEADAVTDAITELLATTPHTIADREVVPDDYDAIQSTVQSYLYDPPVDLIITTGGVGVAPDDLTPDAVGPLLEKRLPGIGEQFRRRTGEDSPGFAASTRVIAGVVEETLVVCLPRDEAAARTGVEAVVLPVLPRVLGQLNS